MCVLLLTAGCTLFSSESATPLQLDFSQALPAGWSPIGSWQEVNIDGDAAVEYLLLFAYDQGQVGAAIYDSQISPDLVGIVGVSTTPAPAPTVTVVPVPLQPFGYFKPYRLLPSFWSYSYGGDIGQGMLALPEDSGRVVVTQVGIEDADQDESTADAAAAAPLSELVIRGGDSHLTFAWWRGPLYGYGISQLAAEGGFRGIDWEAWASAPAPIEQVSGLYPLTDYTRAAFFAARSNARARRRRPLPRPRRRTCLPLRSQRRIWALGSAESPCLPSHSTLRASC